MYSVHALSGGYRGVFHGACPLCLRAPHLFTIGYWLSVMHGDRVFQILHQFFLVLCHLNKYTMCIYYKVINIRWTDGRTSRPIYVQCTCTQWRIQGVFHGACPLCLRAPHLFTMPHPRKIPGIDWYSGFIKKCSRGVQFEILKKIQVQYAQGGGGGQFEILKNPGYRLL